MYFNLIAWFCFVCFVLFVFKYFIYRQMKSPAITATMYGGNKTLYLQVIWTYVIDFNILNLLKCTEFEKKKLAFFFLIADSSFNWRTNKAKSFQDTERYGAVRYWFSS